MDIKPVPAEDTSACNTQATFEDCSGKVRDHYHITRCFKLEMYQTFLFSLICDILDITNLTFFNIPFCWIILFL